MSARDESFSFLDMTSTSAKPIASLGGIWFHMIEIVNGEGKLYLMARVGGFDIVCRTQELTHVNIADLVFEMCERFGLENPFEC